MYILRFFFLFFLLFVFIVNVGATNYYVSVSGNDSNPGSEALPFRSVQKCADIAMPGDTCFVSDGVYDERVITKRSGSEGNRIIFKANGKATIQGFYVDHSYITLDGFDITGFSKLWQFHVSVSNKASFVEILNNTIRDGIGIALDDVIFRDNGPSGDTISSAKGGFLRAGFKNNTAIVISSDSEILNSGWWSVKEVTDNSLVLRDDVPQQNGTTIRNEGPVYAFIRVSVGGISISGNNVVVRNNVISNLHYPFINVNGYNILIENNELKNLNGEDAIRFFGHDNVFRRNYIHDDKKIRGNGNHPDFVQTFGDNGGESYNMLFEENWIENLSSQVGQLNSGGGGRPLDPDFYNYTFKNNVFVNIPGNFNIGVPGVKLINNTFYRTAYTLSGIIYGGSLSRGSAENNVVLNNAFVECGSDGFRFYYRPHFVISSEVFNYFIPVDTTTATNIFNDLRNKGYVTNNGHLQDKFKVINNISEFELDASFSQYKSKVYDLMKQTQEIERISKETFVANYNFVAGKEIYGFPRVTNFNEPNGINGGNPLFVDIKNPLGPDKKPFTQDDGLRPMPSSPLCGSGENGKDIGALSCLIREDKPIAHISLDKEEGYEPLIVSFDASGSYIPQGITVQYYWDFGDGQEATGIKVNHVFNQDGIYTVTLKITDNKGNQSIATRTINVKNTQYPNVILYLPLNGNITDISGKNIQTNPIGTNLIFENGISEQALRTNQSTSRGINITHNDMLDGQNQMSFTFWAKKDNIEEQEVVIIKHTIYQIQITKNGITGYLNTENNGISLTATTNKNYDTQWHHYTITYDGSNVKAYIDGEEILSKPATGKIKIDRSRPLQIGLYPWGESFNGLIDEIIIYDKALNQQEINNIITQKTPISGFYTLTTTKTGTGNGTITSNPPGINCGNDCTENYQQNTTITLTATPEQNSIFDSWTGACTGTNNVCTITMNNNKTTIATFNTTQPNQIQLTITSPTPNTEISGMININAETTSNNPISEIRFFIDANLLGIDNTAPYSTTLNTHYYRNGAHEIKAIAKDNAGNTQTTTIIVKINNADNDNDGVSNIIDKCPNTRTGIKVNNYGCPFPIVDKFDIKPDFNNIDITTMNELEIGITNKGKIKWETTLKLTTTINNTEEPLDLNNDLNINNNKISLNQNKLRELNKPATITLYTTKQNPKIMKDNKECTQCRIIEKTSTYVKFTVPNFEE